MCVCLLQTSGVCERDFSQSLGKFELQKIIAEATMNSDTSMKAHVQLHRCLLTDTRPGKDNGITRYEVQQTILNMNIISGSFDYLVKVLGLCFYHFRSIIVLIEMFLLSDLSSLHILHTKAIFVKLAYYNLLLTSMYNLI